MGSERTVYVKGSAALLLKQTFERGVQGTCRAFMEELKRGCSPLDYISSIVYRLSIPT